MARMIRTQGACPVCDRAVARIVRLHHGVQAESFRCPEHGRLEYGNQQVPLAELGAYAAKQTAVAWSGLTSAEHILHAA